MGLTRKGLMSKARFRFRRRAAEASIDGVRAEYKAQVRQFLQPLILVESLCPGHLAFRRTGVAPCDEPADATCGRKPAETERVVWTELKRKRVSPL